MYIFRTVGKEWFKKREGGGKGMMDVGWGELGFL